MLNYNFVVKKFGPKMAKLLLTSTIEKLSFSKLLAKKIKEDIPPLAQVKNVKELLLLLRVRY